MECELEDGKMCELKEMFTAMDARQRSFEARQANNEIKIANTDKNVAIMQKDLSETKAEFVALASKVSVNTEQLIEIKSDITPITEGVEAIHTAMKPWIWVLSKVRWIITSILAAWVIFMDGLGHLQNLFKGHH